MRDWAISSLLLFVISVLPACADGGDQHSCVPQMAGDLVTSAQMFKLDIYGSGVACTGNAVAKGAVPQETRTFTKQEPINLDIGPGHRTMVLTTYADLNAVVPTGAACSAQDLQPGGKACFNLHVTPYCDANAVHCADSCCTANNGTCDASCVLTCNAGFGDCNGQLSDGCETALAGAGLKVCDSACIDANSCCTDADCTAKPAPAACYAGTCPGAGGTCVYGLKSTATVCGNMCCNAIGGSCDTTDCSVTCSPGFFDCNGNPNDGCESDLNSDPNNCGSCGRACASGKDDVLAPACSAGVCTSTCEPGWSNCNQPAAPDADDGCESNTPGCCGNLQQEKHTDGFGQNFYDCTVPGNYSVTLATEAAMAYNPAGTATAGGASNTDPTMPAGSVSAMCITNATATNCVCWVYDASGAWISAIGYAALGTPSADNPTGCVVPLGASTSFPQWN